MLKVFIAIAAGFVRIEKKESTHGTRECFWRLADYYVVLQISSGNAKEDPPHLAVCIKTHDSS